MQDETIEILNGETFTTYDVEFNGYSFGFIDSATYYTFDIKTYGSIFKREVAVIEIRSIESNEVLYTSGTITIANQSKWD